MKNGNDKNRIGKIKSKFKLKFSKKNISIKVEPYTTGGLDAAKTYIENRDSNGNVIRTQYISNSVYKNKNN